MVARLCFLLATWFGFAQVTPHMNLMTCHNQEEEDGDKKLPSVGTLGQLSFVTSSRERGRGVLSQAGVGERGVLCKKLGKPILCKETDRVWICQPLMYKTHMDQLTRMVKMTMSVITEDQYFNFELS